MSDEGRELWLATRSLSELGELTASWLEGRIGYLTSGATPQPDDEIWALVPALAAVNRAGFVTDSSQPGQPAGARSPGWIQRAAVTGFCDYDTKNRIAALGLKTDLVALASPPGAEFDLSMTAINARLFKMDWVVRMSGAHVCVSSNGERGVSHVGGRLDDAYIDRVYGGEVHPDGVRALHEAWQVAIVDPVWGRNDLLWPRLVEALTDLLERLP